MAICRVAMIVVDAIKFNAIASENNIDEIRQFIGVDNRKHLVFALHDSVNGVKIEPHHYTLEVCIGDARESGGYRFENAVHGDYIAKNARGEISVIKEILISDKILEVIG